jgi:hypothetical protein
MSKQRSYAPAAACLAALLPVLGAAAACGGSSAASTATGGAGGSANLSPPPGTTDIPDDATPIMVPPPAIGGSGPEGCGMPSCSALQWWNAPIGYQYINNAWYDTDLRVSSGTPVVLRHASKLDKEGVYAWGWMPEFTDTVTGERFRFLHLRPSDRYTTSVGTLYDPGTIVGLSGGDTFDTGHPSCCDDPKAQATCTCYSTGAHLCVQTKDPFAAAFPPGQDACVANCPAQGSSSSSSSSTSTTSSGGSSSTSTSSSSTSTSSGGTSCGSSCTQCVLGARTDILPFYKQNGWDTSCGNLDNIVKDWSGIDPTACYALHTGGGLCASACASTVFCGTRCSQCIFGNRSDLVPFYEQNGWSIQCNNLDNIINNWCGIDPAGCSGLKTGSCAAVCM